MTDESKSGARPKSEPEPKPGADLAPKSVSIYKAIADAIVNALKLIPLPLRLPAFLATGLLCLLLYLFNTQTLDTFSIRTIVIVVCVLLTAIVVVSLWVAVANKRKKDENIGKISAIPSLAISRAEFEEIRSNDKSITSEPEILATDANEREKVLSKLEWRYKSVRVTIIIFLAIVMTFSGITLEQGFRHQLAEMHSANVPTFITKSLPDGVVGERIYIPIAVEKAEDVQLLRGPVGITLEGRTLVGIVQNIGSHEVLLFASNKNGEYKSEKSLSLKVVDPKMGYADIYVDDVEIQFIVTSGNKPQTSALNVGVVPPGGGRFVEKIALGGGEPWEPNGPQAFRSNYRRLPPSDNKPREYNVRDIVSSVLQMDYGKSPIVELHFMYSIKMRLKNGKIIESDLVSTHTHPGEAEFRELQEPLSKLNFKVVQ